LQDLNPAENAGHVIMATVAEQLRLAREKLGLTVYDVAEATKIKTDHVRALEEGNYNVFAAPVYIRGFVRTCAMLLKLDVKKVMTDLEGELSGTARFKDPPNLTGKPKGVLDRLLLQISKVPWQWALLIAACGLLLAAGWVGYRTWEHFQNRDPLKDLGPGLYSPPKNSGEVLPLPGK
jgi:cytoskeletal protein RodZ